MQSDNNDSPDEKSDAQKLFEIGHLEKIISWGLRSCIHAHGPITREWIGSAAKRVAQNIRGQLIQYAGQTSQDIALAKYKQELAEDNRRIHEINTSLRKQRDDLLEKLRKGETLGPS